MKKTIKPLESVALNTGGASKQRKENKVKQNAFIYFQLGLILCLLLAYALLEAQFKNPADSLDAFVYNDTSLKEEPITRTFEIYKEPVAEPVQKQTKSKVLTSTPKIVSNDTPEPTDFKDVFTEPKPSNTLNVSDIVLDDKPEDMDEIYNMMGVEVVPVYPGCESFKTNQDRKSCMSDNLAKLIQRKFNTGISEDQGLHGVQRIHVQFKINANGKVTDVMARAPNSDLEHEAVRVLGQIPVMTPGKQRDKPVSVIYTMPIIFKVQE